MPAVVSTLAADSQDGTPPRRLVAITTGARICWALATLATAAITAQYLGPSGRGVLVAAVAWTTLFSTCGHLSLSQVVVYVAAKNRDVEWLPAVVGGLLALLLIATLAGSLVAVALYVTTSGSAFQHIPATTLAMALGAFPLLMCIEDLNGVLMSMGKLEFLSATLVLNGVATVILTLLAVGPLGLGVNGAMLAFGLSGAVTVAATLSFVLKEAGRVSFNWSITKTLLTGGVKLHLNAIGTYLFTQANVLILNHYRSADETAWFQLAFQLVAAVQIVPMAAATVTYSLASKYGPDAAWPHQRTLLFEVLGVVGLLGVVGYVAAPTVLPWLFGTAFAPAVPIFRTLLLSVLGMTLSTMMASQWIARGFFVQASALTLLLGGLTVIGNYLAVRRSGVMGAAWVTNAVYFISLLCNGSMAFWVQSRYRGLATADV